MYISDYINSLGSVMLYVDVRQTDYMILGAIGNRAQSYTQFEIQSKMKTIRRRRRIDRQSDRERLGLFVTGVTILLSQTVFSLLVAQVITKSSEAVPLIG